MLFHRRNPGALFWAFCTLLISVALGTRILASVLATKINALGRRSIFYTFSQANGVDFI